MIDIKSMIHFMFLQKNNDDCVSPSEASYVYKEGTRVQLLDWCESKDVVVAEGHLDSLWS